MHKQAVEYFRREKGFHRLLNQFIKKYQGLGRIGGSVKLNHLSAVEKEALSSLMRRDYHRQKSVSVSMASFERALQRTKFAGITLKELLDGFVGQDIPTREDLQRHYQSQKSEFFQKLMQGHSDTNCQLWLQHIINKGFGTRGIHRAYDIDANLLQGQLTNILMALEQLPTVKGSYERLPFFASRITGDPHGLDLNSEQGRMLLAALQFVRKQQDKEYQYHSVISMEDATELLGYFGIIRDDLLNFVTCTGILGFEQKQPHALWQCAWQQGSVLNVPMREMIKIDHFIPAVSYQNSNRERVVFMVENSGVCSEILDHFADKKLPPLICTHGQLKLANLFLLDKLVQQGTTIFYSGDFDPEGLQMAQRILDRYGQYARLWCYSIADYLNSLSEVELNDNRLKKLTTVVRPEFANLKEEMNKQRQAGYQEYLVQQLIKDIKVYLNN